MAKKNIDETHEWRCIEEFIEGDYITGLGTDMRVTRVKIHEKTVRLFYVDANSGEKVKIGAVGEEYVAKKREE